MSKFPQETKALYNGEYGKKVKKAIQKKNPKWNEHTVNSEAREACARKAEHDNYWCYYWSIVNTLQQNHPEWSRNTILVKAKYAMKSRMKR